MIMIFAAMVLLYSFQSLFLKYYTLSRKGSGAMQFSIVYGVAAGACTLALNGFAYAPSAATLTLGLGNAVILLLYNLSMSRAGTLGSYAFMMICVLSGGILVPMVYDVLCWGASFSAMQLAAVAIMLAAFIIMNLDGFREKKSGKYLIWCLALFAANGAYGVLMNLQQRLANYAQHTEMIVTSFLGMGLITAVAALIKSPRMFINDFRMSGKSLVFMLASATCATLAVNLFMYSMKRVDLTVLNVINNGGVLVVSAIFAFALFRERPAPRTLIGMAMACISIVILSL